MPREIRKRGKKKSKTQENEYPQPIAVAPGPDVVEPSSEPAPAWMRNAPSTSNPLADIEAPFGYVDADVKAYFRTIDLKLREWQDGTNEDTSPEGVDTNEDRKAFILAALSEMESKELQLATDPDCSAILERLAHSMDDFARRVLMDKLAGSYVKLAKHRFASHVCQTNFALAQNAILRESATVRQAAQTDENTLRSTAELVADAAEEILDSLSSLIMDPFGSHVVRTLLSTLSPDYSENQQASHAAAARSKKSAAFKARQGSMKAVVAVDHNSKTPSASVAPPAKLVSLAMRMVEQLRTSLSDNEIRALASDKVASPALQMMLRVESEGGQSEQPGSLMDRVLMGMITRLDESPSTEPIREDYIETLLRDPTSSHLVEALLSYSPPRIFSAIWSTYFAGRLVKLATHPVANFVVAKAVLRLDGNALPAVMEEMGGAFGRTVKLGRTGVQRALVDRAAQTGMCEREIIEALCNAFGFDANSDRSALALCILSLQTLEDRSTAQKVSAESAAQDPTEAPLLSDRRPSKGKGKQKAHMTFSTQGAVLLQSMLRVHEPHNQVILDSILSLPIEELLSIACDPSGSRILDVILEPASPSSPDTLSPQIPSTIPFKARKRLIMKFIESDGFITLVDDKLGSRVADRCWAAADPYLRERIAKSLMPHENFLAGSFYGKFFARNLHLTLLRRKPDEWKKMQMEQKNKALNTGGGSQPHPTQQSPSSSIQSVASAPRHEGKVAAVGEEKRKKRKRDDVIEDIFESTTRHKRPPITPSETITAPQIVSNATTVPDAKLKAKSESTDKSMADVLGAIKEVPKGTALREGKRHKKGKV